MPLFIVLDFSLSFSAKEAMGAKVAAYMQNFSGRASPYALLAGFAFVLVTYQGALFSRALPLFSTALRRWLMAAG